MAVQGTLAGYQTRVQMCAVRGGLTVGSSSVAIVQDGAVGSAGTDGRVGGMSTAAQCIAAVQEHRLQAVLHHAWPALLHDLEHRGAGPVQEMLDSACQTQTAPATAP